MKIAVSRGATINIGNYESARIDISIEGDTGDDQQTFDSIESWLCRTLEGRVAAIQKAAGLPAHPANRFTGHV